MPALMPPLMPDHVNALADEPLPPRRRGSREELGCDRQQRVCAWRHVAKAEPARLIGACLIPRLHHEHRAATGVFLAQPHDGVRHGLTGLVDHHA